MSHFFFLCQFVSSICFTPCCINFPLIGSFVENFLNIGWLYIRQAFLYFSPEAVWMQPQVFKNKNFQGICSMPLRKILVFLGKESQ